MPNDLKNADWRRSDIRPAPVNSTDSQTNPQNLYQVPPHRHEALSDNHADKPMRKLNILVVSHSMPIFPGGAGHEFLNLIHLRGLARHVGLVSQAHTPEELHAAARLRAAGVDVYLYQNTASNTKSERVDSLTTARQLLRKVRSLLIDTWRVLSPRPSDIGLNDLYFRNIAPHILDAIRQRVWDVLIVVQSNAAEIAKCLPSFRANVLVFHDIRHVVFERRKRLPLGLADWFLSSVNAKKYARFEAGHAKEYSACVTLSNDDAASLKRLAHDVEPLVVPIPVDTNFFQKSTEAEDNDLIVFTGMMNHPPNVDAAIFLATKVLPLLRAKHPSTKLMVVGKNPAPEVHALANIPGVEVKGFVPDIRPFIEQAAIFAVPLRFASGVRNKILEAWALQKCVVSTSIGAEGLDYRDGYNIVIADTAETLAQSMASLLGNTRLRSEIGHRGREVVVTQHAPKTVAKRYYEGLTNAVASRKRQRRRYGFDLRWMTPGKAGGLEVQARSLINELTALNRTDEFSILLPNVCAYDFDLRSRQNYRVIPSLRLKNVMRHAKDRFVRKGANFVHVDYWKSPEVETLRQLREFNIRLLYSFPGYIYPDVRPLKHIVNISDIQHEYFPEFFSDNALEERRRLFGEAIGAAEHVVTISDFTKQTLVERLGVPSEKITTIHLAAGPHFVATSSTARDEKVIQKYGLAETRYLYLPGHTWKHKNHISAVRALNILRREGHELDLVLTGAVREANAELVQAIRELDLTNHVHFLGYCPHEDIPTLYRGAAALIFPSLFEGFGMPVLEAMASGCPVVCSNTSSLPEVGGDAVLYCDPMNAEQYAGHIDRLLRKDDERQFLIQRGLTRAMQFSWRRHAMGTMKVLDQQYQRLFG